MESLELEASNVAKLRTTLFVFPILVGSIVAFRLISGGSYKPSKLPFCYFQPLLTHINLYVKPVLYLCEKVFFFFFFYDEKDMLFFLYNQIDFILTSPFHNNSCIRHFKIHSILI